MIRDVSIENYKSLSEFTLELGRVNVFIGANGCGKSNILEAIILGAAWAAGKLDNEFLANRGIRIGDPRLLRCGFDRANLDRPIRLACSGDDRGKRIDVALEHDEGAAYSGWRAFDPETGDDYDALSLGEMLQNLKVQVKVQDWPRTLEKIRRMSKLVEKSPWFGLGTFLTYAPQIATLRQLQVDSPIEPLGLHGEGLFRLLRVLEREGQLGEVNQAIAAIDWFDGLELVGNGGTLGQQIRIVDQFLDPEFPGLDHRSANEGFLFFLFYIALLVSRHTPRFFAVENVDESLNPKLCVHLVETIVKLSTRHDKQVILTTHNPAVLDGLDLDDDEQRLFVIYRNADGHTRARRIGPTDRGDRAVRLSEAFIRGYLGGLPTNF